MTEHEEKSRTAGDIKLVVLLVLTLLLLLSLYNLFLAEDVTRGRRMSGEAVCGVVVLRTATLCSAVHA